MNKIPLYKNIAIAGTFDHLHEGHQLFIRKSFYFGNKVIIGLMSDNYVEAKFKVQSSLAWPPGQAKFKIDLKIQNYQIRKRELINFLKKDGVLGRAEIIEIDDVYGPAIEKNEIEALLVTKETRLGARLVNKKRQENGLKPLKIITIPLVIAEDKKRISSSRVRNGEIDRRGRVFMNAAMFQNANDPKQISEELRSVLKKPQGLLLKGDSNNHKRLLSDLYHLLEKINPFLIITVGDEVTKLCNQMEIPVNLAIVDYKVNRKKVYSTFADLAFPQDSFRSLLKGAVIRVKNPAGTISQSLIRAVKKSIKALIIGNGQRIIRVIGEEDLAGVPAILLAPLDSVVLYGQPQEGLVVVSITEEKKQALLNLIKRYSNYLS